jgi:hypothetical protein
MKRIEPVHQYLSNLITDIALADARFPSRCFRQKVWAIVLKTCYLDPTLCEPSGARERS